MATLYSVDTDTKQKYLPSSVKNQRFLPAIHHGMIAPGNHIDLRFAARSTTPGEAFAACGRCRPTGATNSNNQERDKRKFETLQAKAPRRVAGALDAGIILLR